MSQVFPNLGVSVDPKLCCVMMSFAPEFDAIYRLIQRCCEQAELKCVRADDDAKPGKITDKIYDLLSKANIIIVDMTGRNANVFYELGLAHAINDNVILLAQSTDDVPFDLRDFYHIQYANSFEGSERLATELSKMLATIVSSADQQIPHDDARRHHPLGEPDEFPAEELDLGLAHLQAEIARSSNDMKQAREWLQKALEATKAGGGHASEIGNCAIEAERCKFYELAESLYAIAVERDPMHVNNRQSYVSFLLDHRASDPRKVEIAGKLLGELAKTVERQERTRGLTAQYQTILQKDSGQPVDLDEIIKDLIGDGNFKSLQEAAPALMVLLQAKKYDGMKEIIDGLRGKLPEDEILTLDRVLADAYASSDDDDLRNKAIETYEELLQKKYEDATDVKHNLATLLHSRDTKTDNQRANVLWTEAYGERPSDGPIRKAFAQYLVRSDRKTDAVKVLAGQPID